MVRVAAAAAAFDRDLEAGFGRIAALVRQAREASVGLLVLPEAALGGYLTSLDGAAPGDPTGQAGAATPADGPPPALRLDGPEVARLAALAGDVVLCAGFCEDLDGQPYNSAVCVHDGRVLGVHRKVHQPLGEGASYRAGERFAAFDTPAGRIGMMICYDKAFPEAARELALDGAQLVACLSAWPASRTDPAPRLADDRWTYRFDLFDTARALENQLFWVSANQCGTFGELRFVASAKVVDPGGRVLAATGTGAGLAIADAHLDRDLDAARRRMFHLRDRRPAAYPRQTSPGPPVDPRPATTPAPAGAVHS